MWGVCNDKDQLFQLMQAAANPYIHGNGKLLDKARQKNKIKIFSPLSQNIKFDPVNSKRIILPPSPT